MKFKVLTNTILLALLSCIASFDLSGQVTNPCGVVARIYPGTTDSVVAANTNITLTNTSVNATSIEWLLNGDFPIGSAPTLNYGITTGVFVFSLVAHNGNCSDTTTVVYFSAGTAHSVDSIALVNYGQYNTSDKATSIDNCIDSGFVLGGYNLLVGCGGKGTVVKLSKRGCIDWSKYITGPFNCDYSEVRAVYASADTNYYAIVDRGVPVLIKFDKNGIVQWMKRWLIQGTTSSYVGNTHITGGPDGAVYISSGSLYNGFIVLKLDPNGNLLWNKFYRQGNFNANTPSLNDHAVTTGLIWLDNKIYVSGFNFINSSTQEYYSLVARLDAGTGNTEWQYGYSDEFNGFNKTRMAFGKPVLYDSMLLIAGHNDGQWVTLIDKQGNVRKCIKARFDSSYTPLHTKAEVDKNGKIYIMQAAQKTLPLQPYYANYNNFAKFDTSLNKYWGLTYSTIPGGGVFADAALSDDNSFAALGTFNNGFVDNGFFSGGNLRMLKVDTPATGSNFTCNFNVNFNLTVNLLKRINFSWTADSTFALTPVSVTDVTVADAYIQSRYSCPDFIDSCSFMRISGPRKLCSLGNIYTYKLHRNRKCVLLPQWKLPSGVTMVAQTDSSITISFTGFGYYLISASLQSCIPVKDSLYVTISPPNTQPLNLGIDTSICLNTTITLRAGPTYQSYLWSTGGTDSILTVAQPGLYWVEVADACGNILRDSILINPFSTSINIGPDRIKCNADTVRLSAPGGFISYTWGPDYKINSLVSQNVVVQPDVDTVYYVRAEKTPGCFAYDTVSVKVNNSPPVNLGPDISFCTGDSSVLNAGLVFSQHLWSTGATTSQITVRTAGTYTVIATAANGCKSFDTLRVLNVWQNPVPNLNKDRTLCIGDTRTYNPGLFSFYSWQNGSTGSTYQASGTGVYYVTVTDSRGCKGSDTALITSVTAKPVGFLPADTSICPFQTILIKPLVNFPSYSWSNGSPAPSLSVSQPGIYWLAVRDNNQCVGTDTIKVFLKECLRGLHVPNTFTPNGDGKNDIIKPVLGGVPVKYRFILYNRYGQVVFETQDPQKGWDGRYNGLPQGNGVFVWLCSYQMLNELPKNEEGSVILVR